MSEIGEVNSMPSALTQNVGKIESESKRIIKETKIDLQDNTEEVQHLEDRKKDARDESNVKMIRTAVDTINESLKESHTSIKMKYHDKINRISIKIVNDDTKEVIKEIPPEDTLEMVQKMLEQAGVIVDERG